MKLTPKTRAALIRAARTAGQAFVGYLALKVLGAPPNATDIAHTAVANFNAAAGAGILAGITALGLNRWKPITPEQP